MIFEIADLGFELQASKGVVGINLRSKWSEDKARVEEDEY